MSEGKRPTVTVALHIHTLYSACAETKLEEMGEYCRRVGVDVLGVTDHDTISAALALQSAEPGLRVIIGEEIKTRQGEVIGLFLKEEVEPGLDALETCRQIKDQGGLVYLPHPFDPLKVHRLRRKALMRILDLVDIIEVFNAKTLFPVFNTVARRFADRHNKVKAVGSDAHYLDAIDFCVQEIDDFDTPQQFLENLRHGKLISRRSGPVRAWYVGLKNVLSGEGHVVKRYGR